MLFWGRTIVRICRYYMKSIAEMAEKVQLKNHKSMVFIYLDIILCSFRYGASPKNYYWFGFYDHSVKRETFVTHLMSERIQKKCNKKEEIDLFQNKKRFFDTFSQYMHRTCLESCNISEPSELLALGEKIIYKPIKGNQGVGVRIFDFKDDAPETVLSKIQQLPNGVVESFLQQHKDMSRISNSAVNIVRVVTGYINSSFYILAATAAFSKKLPYTNASGDAIFSNVDIETGIIISNGCDYNEEIYEVHPVSKIRFKSFKIPFWREIIDMVESAAKEIPQIGYVGWDVAITPDGPVIIEGNNDPGYEWMQVRMINPSGIGKKEVYSLLLQ